MIKVEIFLDCAGCLKQLTAIGHSGLAVKGNDILCAAVSAVLRTTGKLVTANPRITSTGSSQSPGELFLQITKREKSETEWLKGITDFCLVSLSDLTAEYPDRLLVNRVPERPPQG